MKTRYYNTLTKFIENGQSVLVLGPRGSGKTFFLSNIINKYSESFNINLLRQNEYLKYSKDPILLENEIKERLKNINFKLYCFIDEVQRVPEILNTVQYLIDSYQDKVCFILTGSSARKLKVSDANLLAGRAISFSFYPFSYDEYDNLNKVLSWGSLPAAVLSNTLEERVAYLETYTNVYLEEEIKKESEIRKLGSFSRFLEYVASQNTKIINYNKISKFVNLHSATVKEYCQILSDTLIANVIPAWDAKLKVQLQKSPKIYFFDCGVINSLTGHLRSELKEGTYRYGTLFESYIVNEIIRINKKKRLGFKIFHYRDQNQREIDLIIRRNPLSPALAIEIKSSVNPDIPKKHIIRTIPDIIPDIKTIVICNTDRAYSEGTLKFLPYKQAFEEIWEMLE